MVLFHEKTICMKFQSMEVKFRGGAKPFKFEWVFLIPLQEYHHYEQQSFIISL